MEMPSEAEKILYDKNHCFFESFSVGHLILKDNPVMKYISTLLLVIGLLCNTSAQALQSLTDGGITRAVIYGLENQQTTLKPFLGNNWVEGKDGALLNVYTPFIEIARSIVQHKAGPTTPTAEDVIAARKKCIEDIHYIYHHPTVKFMISLFGSDINFAKNYYAVLEGVGRGRNVRLLPAKSFRQAVAHKEEGQKFKPYTAINAYYFKFEDIAQLDSYTLRLYGKDKEGEEKEPIEFKIENRQLQ